MKTLNAKIAQVIVGLPVEGPFDYLIGEDLRGKIYIGQRVYISFNHRKMTGFVTALQEKSTIKKLNPILTILDQYPLIDASALALTKALSGHYGCSWGEALEISLPALLRKGKYVDEDIRPKDKSAPEHNAEIVLLHEPEGGKRWDVLSRKIRDTLDRNQGLIFLVPEVAQIDFIVKKLKHIIDHPVSAVDKKPTQKMELERWIRIKKGEVNIVVGTRSSVFSPVMDLGLIIVYDEHNEAYKQEQSPFYHAREVAKTRVAIDGCSLVFVSSAPSAEIWHEAGKAKWPKTEYTTLKSGRVQMIDMNNYNPQRSSIVSFPLQNNIAECLEKQKKVILLLNRKGFSMSTRCNQCGEALKCGRCDVNLTYMSSKKLLICRNCHASEQRPKTCPSCGSKYLRSTGVGIEKLQKDMARFYPQAKISHYDKESVRFPASADIVIATQAVLRNKTSISADLIAVLDFDAQLNRVDFRSGQKAFSMLIQLRELAQSKLLIQTRMMDNYCIQAVKKPDFEKFYREELKQRKELSFPPYAALIAIGVRGMKEEDVFKISHKIYERLTEAQPDNVDILDPHPDVTPKLRDKYRYTIMALGKNHTSILLFIKKILKGLRGKKGVIITVNVDS